MPKIFLRIVAILLMTCLIADSSMPGEFDARGRHAVTALRHDVFGSNSFAQEALAPHALAIRSGSPLSRVMITLGGLYLAFGATRLHATPRDSSFWHSLLGV